MTSIPDTPLAGGTGSLRGAARGRCSMHEHIMLAVLAVTIAACCWLISAAPGVEEGHQPWQAGSLLRVLTNLMALNFEYPTSRGTEIKWLIQGLGAAAALIVGAAAWYANTRRDDDETGDLSRPPDAAGTSADTREGSNLSPAGVAQWALVVFAAWMMLSARWSPWPEVALGEGIRQLIITIWAIALGRTLSRRGAYTSALILAGILAITAMLGIWYRIERNPYQRLKFPIGNPLFLASCLLPGITLTISWLIAALTGLLRSGRETAPRGATGDLASARINAWWLVIGSALGLIALLWAFKWTDSRGPQIGLILGFVVAICVWATGWLRRGLLIAIFIILIMVVGYLYLFGWPDFITRRIDTVMFRLYCWSYAIQLFLEQPFIGKGQTSYVLLAQSLSIPHAEYAPNLFPAQLLGHAHNEWLEILADLGAVGFALMAVGLGATFWAAVIGMRRAGNRMARATIFGLLAAFAGILVAEATGVALRMPGLPVIFYTVIGLIWAMSQADQATAGNAARYDRSTRLAVLVGAVFASIAIGTVVLWDWRGALADHSAIAYAREYRWDEALRQAEIARQQRFVVEGRLSAENQYNFVAYQAAVHRFQQFHDMLARLEHPGRPPDHVLQLAREDSAVFNNYAQRCIESGQRLLGRMPNYPFVAGRVANVLLLAQKMEKEAAENQLGLVYRNALPAKAPREWLVAEYQRDRLDPVISLQLFRLSRDRSPAELIDLLQRPLRRGPGITLDRRGQGPQGQLLLDLFGDFELALATLTQKPGFQRTMDAYVATARECLSITDAASWPHPYAPETLRLAAWAKKLNRQFDEAVSLTSDAIRLSEKLTDRFPALVSYALIDQARNLLLAHSDEPERALKACQQAIDRWPASGDKAIGLALRRSLTIYLLAAGDEQGARQCLASLEPRWSEQDLDRLIGYGLCELCQKMKSAFGPSQLPRWFDDRLRRCLELVPDWPDGRFFAAHVALECGDTRTAVAHIEAMVPLVDDPSQMARLVIILLEHFPANSDLKAFARMRFGIVPSDTQPATTAPAAIEPLP